ncbi:MAG: hypothetical protein AAB358_04130 [Patescibacteria group bacterium]
MTDEHNNSGRFCLNATIDRLAESGAVIRTADGQEIVWPIAGLPEGTSEGAAIKLTIVTDEVNKIEQEKLAKAVLNEILKTQ